MIPINLTGKIDAIKKVILPEEKKDTPKKNASKKKDSFKETITTKIQNLINENEAFFKTVKVKTPYDFVALEFEKITALVKEINEKEGYAEKFKFKEGEFSKSKMKIKNILDTEQVDAKQEDAKQVVQKSLDPNQVAIYEQYDNIVKKELMQAYGIMSCPYCNASYIFNRGAGTAVQFDHFYPRSIYPIFSLCIYNLVPSCYACNNTKSSRLDEIVSPYSKKCKMEGTKFTYELDDKYFTNHNLKICTNTNPGNDKMFHITELYKRFDFEAERIVESYLKYNTNFEGIYKKFKFNDGFKEQIREILLHKKSNITSEDCLNEILLKFRSDIFNQIASKNE